MGLRIEAALLAAVGASALAVSAGAVELPPETARTRLRLRDVILGPPARARWVDRREFSDDGHAVRFETAEVGEHTFYLFLTRAEGGDFPTVREGNVSIKRRGAGLPVYMTIYLRRDSGSYLRLHPMGRRVRLEAYVFDAPVLANVVLPLTFEEAVVAPLARLIELTGDLADWDLLLGGGHASVPVSRVLARVRALLARLSDEDDGAFDRAGRPVLIATGRPSRGGLNCAGFAKWIMDGFYAPLVGSLMDIAELKAKDPSIRGNRWSERYESERDPYFGLDWTRNMAVALHRARTGRTAGAESFDVRSLPFLGYIEDVGYPIERIGLALYLLARQNPDRIYLGSINKEFGRDPVLRQHTHVAVFFPLFDASGQFRVAVLERNAETGLAALVGRFPASFVHLVAVPAEGLFAPLDPGRS